MTKGPLGGPFLHLQLPGSGGQCQRLDLGGQAALQAGGLVLVEHALVGHRVDDALGRLEDVSSLGLVAAAVFAILDVVSPSIGASARTGAGLGLGANLVGFPMR